MSFSNYLETEILGWLFGQVSYWRPSISVGLSRQNPFDDGYWLDEPSASDGYSRVLTIAFDWSYESPDRIINQVEILFDEATSDWGLIKYFVLFDEDYYGEMLAYGELVNYRSIDIYHQASFVSGDLEITLA